MSDDYKRVAEALESGAEPEVLCATCPWDRYCISPPSMTSSEVRAELEKAKAQDNAQMERDKAEGKTGSLPLGSLLTAVMMGSADRQATICPVFAVRLRSSSGRHIVDSLKVQMQSWNDGSTT